MATITIRNLPDEVIAQIKEAAQAHGQSMEQEVRQVLARRYGDNAAVLERMRQRWPELPTSEADEIAQWRETGRP